MMKNILLVCGAGMSTSLMVKKMQEADFNHQYHIQCSDTVSAQIAIMKSDIFLLAPHISYMKDEFLPLCQKQHIPFMVIDSLDYTKMDGYSVLEKVTNIFNQYEKTHAFRIILLHSSGGAMSDLLVMDMNKKKNEEEKEWIIESKDIERFEDYENVDVILLAPQICYEKNMIQKKLNRTDTILDVPSRNLYGTFDGRKILNYIHQILKERGFEKI